MKKIGVCLYLIVCTMVFSWGQTLAPSLDTLKSHVYYLASDALKGRDTGTEGQKITAEFVAKSFAQYGLQPLQKENYYHSYNLKRYHRNQLVVKNKGNILFWPWHFFYVSAYNHTDTVDTQLVFAGYGSEAELKSLDIEDNALAILSQSPNEAYKTIKQIAKDHGNKTYFVMLPKKNATIDKAWADNYELSNFGLSSYFDRMKSQAIMEEWAHPDDSLNIYYCFPNVLKHVFMSSDNELEKVAQNSLKNAHKSLPLIPKQHVSLLVNYHDSVDDVWVENVGGFIFGKDRSKTLIVSAHHDHVGEELGSINYGADDNASGTAALLECARLMSADAQKGIMPETNVLFLSFSGEELGLLGSEAFVRAGIVDLNSVYFNINMDMIGRWDERHASQRNFVYLLTAGKNQKKFFKIGKSRLNLPEGFEVSNKPGAKEKAIFHYGSDHYSFLKKDIPIAVFFTGLHPDYHTPRDTPDKINYKNLTTVTSVVYQYIYKIAAFEAANEKRQ